MSVSDFNNNDGSTVPKLDKRLDKVYGNKYDGKMPEEERRIASMLAEKVMDREDIITDLVLSKICSIAYGFGKLVEGDN